VVALRVSPTGCDFRRHLLADWKLTGGAGGPEFKFFPRERRSERRAHLLLGFAETDGRWGIVVTTDWRCD